MQEENEPKKKLDIINTILFIVSLICVLFLIWNIGFLLDHKYDVKQCEKYMEKNYQKDNILDCFANEDFNNINFGRNINCECFVVFPLGLKTFEVK